MARMKTQSCGGRGGPSRDGLLFRGEEKEAMMKPRPCEILSGAIVLLFLVSGCSDPTIPFKEKIAALEAEKAATEVRAQSNETQCVALDAELVNVRQSSELLRVELKGLQAQLVEREQRLVERNEMITLASQQVAAVQEHLSDVRSTYGGQSNLIERAKVYTAALKKELATRDRQLKEKDRTIRQLEADVEDRDKEIADLRSPDNAPAEKKRTGLAGPTPVGGGPLTRKVRRLGE